MDDAVHAIMMAFGVLIFIMGLTVAVYMLSQVIDTSEILLYYADETNYYDNIKEEISGAGLSSTDRLVDTDTVISTLYRYYKENFCVKIYNNDHTLLQIFDVKLEGDVMNVAKKVTGLTSRDNALRTLYNTKYTDLYMFEAPWMGNPERDVKARVDFYVNGTKGYINNAEVDYTNNKFYKLIKHNESSTDKIYLVEKFLSYTYSGETMTNDEGDVLVTGAQSKDKIVIQYTFTEEVS